MGLVETQVSFTRSEMAVLRGLVAAEMLKELEILGQRGFHEDEMVDILRRLREKLK